MVKWYRFLHLCMRVEFPDELVVPKNMSQFEINEPFVGEKQLLYTLVFTDDMPALHKKLSVCPPFHMVAKRVNLLVLETETGECRHMFFYGCPFPYAISLQTAPDHWQVWVDRTHNDKLRCDPAFCALFSLEKHMIEQNALILHTAFLCHKGEAILFSGPSGIGKSTQAGLWEQYRGARTINGDKALLTQKNGRWYASGWPVCGSSEICHNEQYPVWAIVMLQQAAENSCVFLSQGQAFRELIPQFTVNTWDRVFQIAVINQLELLTAKLPICRLKCDISQNAVECLEKFLYSL